MPSLRKGDRNEQGGYNYVSIDDYYGDVASVAMRAGITWRIRETDFHMVEILTQRGMKQGARISYAFDLMHEDGSVIENFFSVTIVHPLQGAQTAGSAMSYADKLFMRTTFSVVTGEADADASDSKAFDGATIIPAAPPPVAVEAMAPQDVEWSPADFIKLSSVFVAAAKNEEQLNDYWNKNEKLFLDLKREAPEAFKKLVDEFKFRKAEIQKESRKK